jgi:hypothetical protein
LLSAFILAFLWWRLIDLLHVEWSVNPQYAYGWAVPFLCLYLLWHRLHSAFRRRPLDVGGSGQIANPPPFSAFQHFFSAFQRFSISAFFFLAALAYLPTRLIGEANPDWRLISRALALEVITLTLFLLTAESRKQQAETTTSDSSAPRPPLPSSISNLPSASSFPRIPCIPWFGSLSNRKSQIANRKSPASFSISAFQHFSFF